MHIFIEIGLILAIATAVSLLMRLLRQPLVVGYIISGVIAGPYFLNVITEIEYVELFSKLGIAMLLFIIGLSLKPNVIREVGKISLVTGLGQIVFTSVLGFLIVKLLGFSNLTSLYVAIALTFSSTIIILKLLSDKGDTERLYGKISVGFLLVQDIVATIILLLISFFGSRNPQTSETGWVVLLQATITFFILYIIGKYVLPRLSSYLAHSQEALFLFSITWGLGIAAIFYKFGFSLEIGALVAGVTLSVSPFSHEIASRMKPLRDFFILIFFVMLGSQIAISGLGTILLPAIILSLFVLVGNPIIVIILMNWLGYNSKVGFMAGLTVAQISEFSLILMTLGGSYGHVSGDAVSLVTLVGVITITGSTYLILYADKIYPALSGILKIFEWNKTHTHNKEKKDAEYDMIIFGYDRVGYDFVNVARDMNRKHLVVDFNPESIKKMAELNIPYRFGDAEDAVFLEEIGVHKVQIIVSTIPDFQINLNLANYCRNHNSGAVLIVTSHNIEHTKELYVAGASFVIMPYYLGAQYASKMLEAHGEDTSAFQKEKERHLKYLDKRSVETR